MKTHSYYQRIRTQNYAIVFLLCAAFAACDGAEPNDDAVDDSFLIDGKTDTGSIIEGIDAAKAILSIVNSSTVDLLTKQVGLTDNAANNIVAYRLGDDEKAKTADDETFDTLKELDAIPYVGPIAFGKLVAYAKAQGLIQTAPPVVTPPFGPIAGNLVEVFPAIQQNLRAVWAFSPNDVWLAGDGATLLHWNGSSFESHNTKNIVSTFEQLDFEQIWATSPKDLWLSAKSLVDNGNQGKVWRGAIFHYDGSTWSQVPYDSFFPNDYDLITAIGGVDGAHVWFATGTGFLIWDGASFSVKPRGGKGNVSTFVPLASDNILAINHSFFDFERWNGLTWNQESMFPIAYHTTYVDGFSDGWANSAGQIWVTGPNRNSNYEATPGVFQRDGTSWKQVSSSGLYQKKEIVLNEQPKLWGLSTSAFPFLLSHNRLCQFSSETASKCDMAQTHPLRDLHGSSNDNIWLVGDEGAITRWNGQSFNNMNDDAFDVVDVSEVSDALAFVLGKTKTRHATGEVKLGWRLLRYHKGNRDEIALDGVALDDKTTITDLFATSADQIWLTTNQGKIYAWQNPNWSISAEFSSTTFSGIWGTSAKHLIAVGEKGAVIQWNGTTWNVLNAGTTSDITGVWGSSPTDIWLITNKSETIHGDGASWVTTTLDSDGHGLKQIHGTHAGNIWINSVEGWNAHHYHFDGQTWKHHGLKSPDDGSGRWTSFYAASDNELYLATHSFIYRWDGTSLQEITTTKALKRYLIRSLWRHQGKLYAGTSTGIVRVE